MFTLVSFGAVVLDLGAFPHKDDFICACEHCDCTWMRDKTSRLGMPRKEDLGFTSKQSLPLAEPAVSLWCESRQTNNRIL